MQSIGHSGELMRLAKLLMSQGICFPQISRTKVVDLAALAISMAWPKFCSTVALFTTNSFTWCPPPLIAASTRVHAESFIRVGLQLWGIKFAHVTLLPVRLSRASWSSVKGPREIRGKDREGGLLWPLVPKAHISI